MDPYQQGLGYFRLHNYPAAIQAFTQAINQDKNKIEGLYRISECYRCLGQPQKAEQYFTQAKKSDSYAIKDPCERGNVYYRIGMYQKAIEEYFQVIAIDTKNVGAYMGRAKAESALGQHHKVIKDYSAALRIDPKKEQALIGRGIAYRMIGNYQEALKDFSKAIEINPSYQQAYLNRANIYQMLGELHKAEQDYLRYKELSSETPLSMLNLASVCRQKGKVEQAKKYFDKGIQGFQGQMQKSEKNSEELMITNISEIKETVKQYLQLQAQIKELQNEADKAGVKQQLSKIAKLTEQNYLITTNNITKTICKGTKSDKEASQPEEYLRLKAQIEEIRKHIQELKQFKKDQAAKNKQLESTMAQFERQIKKISDKVHATQNTLTKISSIKNKKQQEYYLLMYHLIINHFLAYRVLSTGFFTQEARTFSDSDATIETITKAQPVFDKIPVLGDLLSIPFQILNTYKLIKTETINASIADKINLSTFVDEGSITNFVSYSMEQLIDNQAFNRELIDAIKTEEESYFNNLFEKIAGVRKKFQMKMIGAKSDKYSYVSEVVTMHMTLIAKKMYECQPEDFKTASSSKQAFFSFLLTAILEDKQLQVKDPHYQSAANLQNEKKQASDKDRNKKQKSIWSKICGCFD